jgi:hypothetical protein
LGSLEELGKGLKAVHRLNRWLDFLLIFIPVHVVFPFPLPLIIALVGKFPADFSQPILALDIRAAILIGLAFCLVGFRRNSTLLLAFWIQDAAMRLVTLGVRENRWASVFETWSLDWIECTVWIVILVGLLVWLARFLWKNRRNLLIVTFAALPLVETLFDVGSDWFSRYYVIYTSLLNWNILGMGVENLVEMGSLAGFWLYPKRNGRWLALFGGVSFFSFERIY